MANMRHIHGTGGDTGGEPSDVLTPRIRLVSNITREEVSWLWRGRLAYGKVTMLDGDPGVSKSTVAAEIAARVTRGEALPGGPPIKAGGVVMLNAEDDEGDTIRPRLEEAGADIGRVAIFDLVDWRGNRRLPTIPKDIDLAEQAIEAVGAALLIVDPLFTYLDDDVNENRGKEVQKALAPLVSLAIRHKLSVIMVRHLNKVAGGAAISRGSGSMSLIGVARFGLVVTRDPDDRTKRVLAVGKANIGQEVESLSYRLRGVPGSDVATIEWLGPSEHTADDLLDQGGSIEERESRSEAVRWLRDKLATGPMVVKDIQRAAREDGFTVWRTMERAKHTIGAVSARSGFGAQGQYTWALPSGPPKVSVHGMSAIERQDDEPPKTPSTPIEDMLAIETDRVFTRDESDPFTEG